MLVTELLGVWCREREPAPPFVVPVSTRTEDEEGSLPIRRALKPRALKRVSCHQRELGRDSGVVDGSTVV
jgi:hypothetical protein